jgi:hypothetical protein
MTGYAAMARVSGGRVRAIAWHAPAEGDARGREPEPVPVPVVRRGVVLPAGPRMPARDRWAWIRDEVGMMTFYLLDPESWR